MDQAAQLIDRYNLKVIRIHTHIGSGSDPAVWQHTANLSLKIVERFHTVHTLNLGGGYKVARMANEVGTVLKDIAQPVKHAFQQFYAKTGRQIDLEIEPGTYLVANGGSLIARVQDVTDTYHVPSSHHTMTHTAQPGVDIGHKFVKLDTGMTELLRPCLYGAQHPVIIVPQEPQSSHQPDSQTDIASNAHPSASCGTDFPAGYSSDVSLKDPHLEACIVVGHCCESGDLITCAPGDADTLLERRLRAPTIGDWCVIEGVGAYCSSMSATNYNSFPEAPEVLLQLGGQPRLIRKRQTLDDMVRNEI